MKKSFPRPLKIICKDFGLIATANLLNMLSLHFERVELFADEILAHSPRNMEHYASAWRELDRLNVKIVSTP